MISGAWHLKPARTDAFRLLETGLGRGIGRPGTLGFVFGILVLLLELAASDDHAFATLLAALRTGSADPVDLLLGARTLSRTPPAGPVTRTRCRAAPRTTSATAAATATVTALVMALKSSNACATVAEIGRSNSCVMASATSHEAHPTSPGDMDRRRNPPVVFLSNGASYRLRLGPKVASFPGYVLLDAGLSHCHRKGFVVPAHGLPCR